ncbi:methyl-accepting chemotaxis protein [Solirubrobacter phytolaccae]|uniref:Methyl-accepting chemotaxis protein n=1 Tax=Solirubrobacter phytolaccae TaxID=1404360 RepID=A0A9X3NNS8_9ACTN|nr:methyl-accepting chemotaxis protein [Solirubrobacter phytolaccae]MDA0184842.1 methyl-accepting chemotaxis protein [Solirubrobacter phytolaccae]
MSRFTPNRPEHLVASIVALAEQSNRLALDAAMEAARADSQGRTAIVVDQICRLAVGAGVSAGEIVWLVSELETATEDHDFLSEAGVAVAGMESCLIAVTEAVQEVADRGAPVEVSSSAEALRRVTVQLAELLPRLQPVS